MTMKLFGTFVIMKICSKCNISQDLAEFRKDSSTKDGKHPHCRTCFNKARKRYYKKNKEKERATSLRCYHKNKAKYKTRRRVYSWKYAYGIELSVDEYNSLLKKQNHKCAICLTPTSELDKLLSVDHDHKTGKIRGLLCSSCNLGLGDFRDDISRLKNAIKYLS